MFFSVPSLPFLILLSYFYIRGREYLAARPGLRWEDIRVDIRENAWAGVVSEDSASLGGGSGDEPSGSVNRG